MSESTGTRVPRKQGVPPRISGSLTITDSRSMKYLPTSSLAGTVRSGFASPSLPQVRSCRCGAPDWTVSNSREYLLTGIANAVPKTTRQRAGRQAETVVGVGPPGPANTTTRLPAGPAAHHAVPGLPPGEDAWRSAIAEARR